jgi:hypothetical protein
VVVGELVLLCAYALTDPAANINWVFGPGATPQSRIPSRLYLALVMVFFPVFVYWPTHLILRRLFPGAR